jgi:hypothetical protein
MLTSVPSGEAYRRIRLAHHSQDWDWKTAWEHCIRPAYRKSDMDRLQQGNEHEALRDALDQLFPFPGLWMDLQMLFFHGLGAVNCVEVSSQFPSNLPSVNVAHRILVLGRISSCGEYPAIKHDG